MFQRLTNLLFGSANETTQEPTLPKPASPEVDEEGWLLVNPAGQYSYKYLELRLKIFLDYSACIFFMNIKNMTESPFRVMYNLLQMLIFLCIKSL